MNAFTLMMNDDTRLKTSRLSKKEKRLPPKSKKRKKRERKAGAFSTTDGILVKLVGYGHVTNVNVFNQWEMF